MRPFYKALLLIAAFAVMVPSAFAQSNKSREDQIKDIKKLETNTKPKDVEKAYNLAKAFVQQFGQPSQEEAPTLMIAGEKYRRSLATEISKLSNSKKATEQQESVELAKRYVMEFGDRNDILSNQIKDYALNRTITSRDFAGAFDLGLKMLDSNPDDLFVKINVAYAGHEVFSEGKDKSGTVDTVEIAKEAISALVEGKLPSDFRPFTGKDDALANLHLIIGNIIFQNNLREGAKNFRMALQYPSGLDNSTKGALALRLAGFFEREFEQRKLAFDSKYPRNDAPEAVRVKENTELRKLFESMADAYARGIIWSRGSTSLPIENFQARLTEILVAINYEGGSEAFLSSISSKPIPEIE